VKTSATGHDSRRPNLEAERRVEIGDRLRRVRVARGLSQEDVAEASEVTRAAVSQWEKGIALPQMLNLERAAERLGCPIEWLRTGVGNEPAILNKPVQHGRRALRFANVHDQGHWSHKVDQPPFEGAIAEIAGGIGAGMPHHKADEVFDWWRFAPGFVQEDLRTKAWSLRIFRVQSDSMEPIIRQGSYVMVDTSQTMPHDGKIFAINNGISIVLKRLSIKPGDEKLIGLKDGNEKGEVYKIPARKLKIVGRCIVRIDHL
jgi:transcriptional regulator with XRE-family HTH domain